MQNQEILKNVSEFLSGQKLLSLATTFNGLPWICNVYFGNDNEGNLYFISPAEANHSKHLAQNANVACTTAWFNPNKLTERRAVQIKGSCTLLTVALEMQLALDFIFAKFPDWKNGVSLENMLKNPQASQPYKIVPSYLKYWDDLLFGEEKTVEITF